MDREIAEKVTHVEPELLWNALTDDETATCCSFDSKQEGDEWLARKLKDYPAYSQYHIGAWKRYPAYSTSPVASDQLLEALSRMGWNYDIGRFGSIPALFTVQLYRAGIRHTADSTVSAREAIALCALRSVGIDP
jgi:hypothetical protein